MGSCTRRHFLLSICFLQMITVVERQVFDFLGYMWAPILANFFHIIFVIFGFYGAYHFRVKYIITYLIWNFIWIGWNAFLICFYLNVGILDKDSDVLNLGTGSVSWFEVNGYGCKPVYPINITSEDPYRPVRPEHVDDCLIEYPIVEIIHSGIQCILAILAIIGAILIAYIFLDEDDQFDFMGGDAKSPQHTSVHPMYVSYTSIPTSASATMLSNKNYHNHAINAEQVKQKVNTASTASIHSKINQNMNRKNANYTGFINRPDIKYTQISTEQLVNNLDDSNDNFCLHTFKIDDSSSTYIPFQKPVPIFPYDTNVVHPVRDNSQFLNNYDGSRIVRKDSKKSKQRKSQYSIEFGPPVDTIRGRPDILDYEEAIGDRNGQLSPKPMTPRRVKRRSIMTRGTNSRQSTTSRRSHTSNRSSVRNSRRKYQQNPVTKIIEQQTVKPFASFIHTENPTLTATNLKTLNLKTLNHDIIASSNPKPIYTNFTNSVSPDPIYYNTTGSTVQLQQSWNSNTPSQAGHFNPSYQHSTPNLSNSNEHVDELYNNRPPSVRSSYSNFHGTRPLSSYNPTVTAENVFAGISGGQPNMPLPPQPSSPVQPQVPSRKTGSRESIRSMAFLNNGPPAYNLNYHTPPDSETTM